MGNTRALFASAGASAALVAAAAFALLAVSAVFAFGGSAGELRSSASRPALVLDLSAGSDVALSSRRDAAAPVVLRAPVRPSPRRDAPARSQTRPVSVAAPETRAAVRPIVRTPAAVSAEIPRPIASPPVGTRAPRTGDTVRRVGDDLSSTVQKTGAKLSDVAAPLGPPVSEAVQTVLDRLALLLKRTTDGVGKTLDKLVPPKA